VACGKELAHAGVAVTVIDKHNYTQFQPLLYQVATGMLGPTDIARPLRGIFKRHDNVFVKEAEVVKVDPTNKSVTTGDGSTISGDYLILAMGARANFFKTEGAEEHTFPLYSLTDGERLRSRLFQVLEDADLDQRHIQQGALNFVVIGGGPTGVETAGALADLVNHTLPSMYHDMPLNAAQVYIIDHGSNLLAAFSDDAHDYVAKVLHKYGVHMLMGKSVTQITPHKVVLDDGTEILTRVVVWAGGLMAADLASACGIPQGRGGRLDVEPDLSVDGFPGVYAIGDVANIRGADGEALPQLGSVALQAGVAAGKSIVADLDGKPAKAFHYFDKGIMAMIGKRAAIAEVGKRRHELHGSVAFAAWLGVHAWLMSGMRQRIDAFISWGWDYFSTSRATSVIDRPDACMIDWDDDDDEKVELGIDKA
jgi:NADH dehydrogenase